MASINRGDNTGAFGKEFLRIYLNNPNKLEITKAVIHINRDIEKVYEYPQFPLKVNFTGEETYLLKQDNTCTLAVWDSNGRRRTADGKFTFFVKHNCIEEPDAPISNFEPEETVEDNDIVFDLDDSEFAAKFEINCTPSKMSELECDINILTGDKIKPGNNIEINEDEDGNIIIDAIADVSLSYEDITDKPSINGKLLDGDVTIDFNQVNADWNATEGISQILNKPELKDVALTGEYSDLNNVPEIPTKLSQLKNDTKFIDKATDKLENYYKKDEVNNLVNQTFDTEPIYNAIRGVQDNLDKVEAAYKHADTELDLKIEEKDSNLKDQINTVKNELNRKLNSTDDRVSKIEIESEKHVTQEQLTNSLKDVLTSTDKLDILDEVDQKVDYNTFKQDIDKKADKTSIGKGTLTVMVNDAIKTFNANSMTDVDVDITVPKKISELENDKQYITKEDVETDQFITRDELEQAIGDKANIEELGHGILTITKNQEQIGTFSANSKKDQTLDIETPTKLSQLELDIEILKPEDVVTLNNQITSMETQVNRNNEDISTLFDELGKKVDVIPGKSLLSDKEIQRLTTLQNYDDTEIKQIQEEQAQSIEDIITNVDNKVDKQDGKTLTSNDFTDEYKEDVDTLKTNIEELTKTVQTNQTNIGENLESITELKNKTDNINTKITSETQTREQEISELKDKIAGMTAKASVVDVLATEEDLNTYDTKNLMDGDVICILSDADHEYTTSYYRWSEDFTDFTYAGSEGKYYTQAATDDKFVKKTLMINGHDLTGDVEISASDVGALPDNTVIGKGLLTIQKNKEQLGTFNANNEENVAINIEVPIKVSELENDIPLATKDELDGQKEEIDTSIELMGGEIDLLDEKVTALQQFLSDENVESGRGLAKVAFTNKYSDLDGLPKIPEVVSELENDSNFIGTDEFVGQRIEDILGDYVKTADIPTKVSELENDRGYVTNNAIGRAGITFTVNGQSFENNVWNVNEFHNKLINIPVDNELKDSPFPVTNKAIFDKVNDVDTSCVHIDNEETITGDKTFEGKVTLSTAIGTTVETDDNSTNLATTEYVKNQDYCTNTNAVHKDQEETIIGNKTFTGDVILNNATGITLSPEDNSTNLATTEFVKSQKYATDSNTVHLTGDQEIHGNKTFADTTTFIGIVQLGDDAHVDTPVDEHLDTMDKYLIVNIEYLNNKLAEKDVTINNLQEQITTLTSTLEALQNKITEMEKTLAGKAEIEHTHDSKDITSLTGYVIGENAEPITVRDSLNTAIGKLEAGIDSITNV